MELTSEQVHWGFGGVLIAASIPLILKAAGRIRWSALDYLVPSLLGLMGIELLLDPLVHGTAAPGGYAVESAQHFLLGALLIGTSLAELVRVKRGAEGVAWRLPLVGALLVAAGVFIFHAQHDSDVPMMLLMIQHRFIGATFAVMALAVFIDAAKVPSGGGHALAFALLTLLLGIELVSYTEGNMLFGGKMEMPSSMGSMP